MQRPEEHGGSCDAERAAPGMQAASFSDLLMHASAADFGPFYPFPNTARLRLSAGALFMAWNEC